MNRMKVFLLLAVMIGFSSCQSRSKQNIEQEENNTDIRPYLDIGLVGNSRE